MSKLDPLNSFFQSFRSEPVKEARHLKAPETFEGIIDDVSIRRGRPDLGAHPTVCIVLKPVDVGFTSASPSLLIHDEVEIEAITSGWSAPPNPIELLEQARQRMATNADRIEREKPVVISYVFGMSTAVYFGHARSLRELYESAFGAEAGLALGRLIVPDRIPDSGGERELPDPDLFSMEHFTDGPNVGEPVSPLWRMLNELRGLRFIVNAVEVHTKSGKSFSRYEWIRSRA